MTAQSRLKGPIRWMHDHGVAANLLMLCLILGGLLMSSQIKKEVFLLRARDHQRQRQLFRRHAG